MDVICHKKPCICGCGEVFLHFYKDINDISDLDKRLLLPINGYSKGLYGLNFINIINTGELPDLFVLGGIYMRKTINGMGRCQFFIEVKRAFQ